MSNESLVPWRATATTTTWCCHGSLHRRTCYSLWMLLLTEKQEWDPNKARCNKLDWDSPDLDGGILRLGINKSTTRRRIDQAQGFLCNIYTLIPWKDEMLGGAAHQQEQLWRLRINFCTCMLPRSLRMVLAEAMCAAEAAPAANDEEGELNQLNNPRWAASHVMVEIWKNSYGKVFLTGSPACNWNTH